MAGIPVVYWYRLSHILVTVPLYFFLISGMGLIIIVVTYEMRLEYIVYIRFTYALSAFEKAWMVVIRLLRYVGLVVRSMYSTSERVRSRYLTHDGGVDY